MSPVSLTLDLLLASLLVITLMFGLRLDRRLKALKASQESFAAAVAELDHAAARAEQGLAEFRTTLDDASGLLASRIDKARDLAAKLETLTAEGVAVAARIPERAAAQRSAAQPAAAAAPAAQPSSPGQRRTAIERMWGRPAKAAASVAPALAAAERFALTLTREDAVEPRRPAPAPRAAPPAPAAPPRAARSRVMIDDELFDGPGRGRIAGARP